MIKQPGYASGDQFAIAAILMNEPNRHVFITYKDDDGFNPAAKIREFYEHSGVQTERIHIIPQHEFKKELKEYHGETYTGSQHKKNPSKFEIGVGDATKRVAETFDDDFRANTRRGWGLDSPEKDEHPRDEDVQKWLQTKGVSDVEGKAVAILWSRFSGKNGEVHVEHDTSYFGMGQLIAGLGNLDYVLIVGDSAPKDKDEKTRNAKYDSLAEHYNKQGEANDALRNAGTSEDHWRGFNAKVVNLTEFWAPKTENDEEKSKEMEAIKKWTGGKRMGQFLLFDYLNRHCFAARHLGYRSGNLEAMALLGFTVLYMEEPDSIGGERMASWHAKPNDKTKTAAGGNAPGYERLITQNPPTRSGRRQVDFPTEDRKKSQKHAEWRNDKDTRHADKRIDGKSRPKGFSNETLSQTDDYLVNGRYPA